MAMHYPRRISRIKRVRSQGFRARMRTKSGRKIGKKAAKVFRAAVSLHYTLLAAHKLVRWAEVSATDGFGLALSDGDWSEAGTL